MILTGPAIAAAVAAGDITIDPFDPDRVSANVYDWRLGSTLRVCTTDLDAAVPTPFTEVTIPEAGYVLEPEVLYLGVTLEQTASDRYAQMLNGDLVTGRLGIWVHVSAPLGHVGHAIRWTLEIRAVRPVRIYPGMTFGKIIFLRTYGAAASYQQLGRKYTSTDGIDISPAPRRVPGGPPMTARVATFLDLPAASPGGSVELFRDLYTGAEPLIPARAFMLDAGHSGLPAVPGLGLLAVDGKCLDEPGFTQYVTALHRALADMLNPEDVDVVHLQHLTFGATPALLRTLPDHPAVALVHGTDLLFAEAHPDQLRVLRDTVRRANVIVVPTFAMADRLLTLAPDGQVVKIPWGIPDHLLAGPPPQRRSPEGRQRLIYAGRLTPEKGADRLTQALGAATNFTLSIAAPPHEFRAIGPDLRRAGLDVDYLGWLSRPDLWKAFADHDALLMPSTTLEAMGLVALEAQACGLPVLYQPVPGLDETLGEAALPTDFTDSDQVAANLRHLLTPDLADDLRTAARTNAARFPLSAAAAALTQLGDSLS